MFAIGKRDDCQTNRGVRFINRADRFHPRGMFGQARAIDEAGGAVVS